MNKDTLSITIGSFSSAGKKDDNQDCLGALIPEEPQLTYKGISAAIADGMSGSDAGKQASHCCVGGFLGDYYSTPDSWTVREAGQKILSATNSWLYSQGQSRFGSAKGMVSTLSILVLKSTSAHLFHIGDSRIYRWRRGNLEQMTRDHRIWLSAEKNYLNRAMGIEPHLSVDYKTFPLQVGDVFVMTTDGVHDFIAEQHISALLSEPYQPDQLAERLVKKAWTNNSDDNLTCQILRIDRLPEAREDEIIRRHANLPFPPVLEPGMLLDDYRIVETLHASKRTHIYRAQDIHSKQTVIIKAPSVLFDDDTHYIEHFLHEEWAGKRLNHTNIVRILNSDRVKTAVYYVTEWINGKTLRAWMDENPNPDIKTVRQMILQISKGLQAMHRMQMLHQDLKPENIMVDANGIVKIIDFGSVKIAGIAEIASPQPEEENILGTLNYTAPEYHLGQRGSVQSDLFSLGVIAYEMLNDALPYGGDMPEKPNRVNLAKLRYVPSLINNDMVPVWMDAALQKATALNPQERYTVLSEFTRDLAAPNPKFIKAADAIPLLERNPLLFWKSLAGAMLLINVLLLLALARYL